MTEHQFRPLMLAPLSIQEKIRLSRLAILFFSPAEYRNNCTTLNKQQTTEIIPLEASDFLHFLEKTNELESSNLYMDRIRELLSSLANAHILTDMGLGVSFIAGSRYFFNRDITLSARKKCSNYWLAPALGPELIYHLLAEVTFQITGVDKETKDVVAGTGIVISPEWILTCAHVLDDMNVNIKQAFNNVQHTILEKCTHKTIDVGLIKVSPPLANSSEVMFSDSVIADDVYTLGYPPVPLSKAPALIMHRGEITNTQITTYDGRSLFLYSAIARPGNSGGPIVGSNGNIVGIVSDELDAKASKCGLPFYSGVRTSDIVTAIHELNPAIELPIEDYS